MADILPPPDPHLTPTEELVLDVLAARFRLGERLWTFNASARRAIVKLADKGLVNEMSGITENTVRASLTDAGRDLWLSTSHAPIESPETKRLKVRNKILAALTEIDEPEAPTLATYLSHKIAEVS